MARMFAVPAAEPTVDFLGIGVQKGGTTWLYHQLSRHPQVAFPRGKEAHYWDAAGRDADEWVRLLQPPSRRSRTGRPIRSGEITPAYSTLPVERIRAIHDRCPGVRLFVSLRNPVERAWSAALMGLARAQMLVHEASDQWFLDHFRSAASRGRGDYVGCLDRWGSVFPADQLLVLFQDDIAARPREVLNDLAGHLGIDAAEFAALPAEDLAEVVVPHLGAGAFDTVPPPLRPSLLPPLLDLYAADIEAIERRTGRDLSAWRLARPATARPRQISGCGATRAADAEA
jgi:hypothetical protein